MYLASPPRRRLLDARVLLIPLLALIVLQSPAPEKPAFVVIAPAAWTKTLEPFVRARSTEVRVDSAAELQQGLDVGSYRFTGNPPSGVGHSLGAPSGAPKKPALGVIVPAAWTKSPSCAPRGPRSCVESATIENIISTANGTRSEPTPSTSLRCRTRSPNETET